MANDATSHYFHAEAHALSGKLIRPFEEDIKRQAFVKLQGPSQQLLLEGDNGKQLKDENGKTLKDKKAQENYLSQHAKNYRLEGIISYSAAHTQVSGHRSKKNEDRFVTLATSVVEDLNVLNVVTADRVVAQISTTHFPDQHSPKVTFLGTHFENLRIARHRADPFLNLELVGPRPVGEKALYVEANRDWLSAVKAQYQKLAGWSERLKAELLDKKIHSMPAALLTNKYYGGNPAYEKIAVDATGREKDLATPAGKSDTKYKGITCSLVENVKIDPIEGEDAAGRPLSIKLPGGPFGHVIHIPDFGTIFLAELTVNHNSFELTMIRLELGCLADGSISITNCNVNGGGKGGGGHLSGGG